MQQDNVNQPYSALMVNLKNKYIQDKNKYLFIKTEENFIDFLKEYLKDTKIISADNIVYHLPLTFNTEELRTSFVAYLISKGLKVSRDSNSFFFTN